MQKLYSSYFLPFQLLTAELSRAKRAQRSTMANQSKITQSTGMATHVQMQLEVNLVGDRIATL